MIAMPRFVVQHHILGPDREHWDLMFEAHTVLWTWSLAAPPDADAHLPATAVRIDDHRKEYLEYEGEITRHRGRCEIHDRGQYAWEGDAPPRESSLAEHLVCRIEGERLNGRYELVLCPEDGKDHWRLRRLGE
jgi:DNA polymerase Ligase (LigD)